LRTAVAVPAPGASLNRYTDVSTTLADRESRVYATVNCDYYDRSQPRSVPQHILIRVRREDPRLLDFTGIGSRHLESFQKLRDIVRANLRVVRDGEGGRHAPQLRARW